MAAATLATFPRNHAHVLVHCDSCLQGGSYRLGQPGPRARTTIAVLTYVICSLSQHKLDWGRIRPWHCLHQKLEEDVAVFL